MSQSEYDDELIDILWINPKRRDELDRVGPSVQIFIEKKWPDYVPGGAAAESFARDCCERRLRQYLAQDCTPWEVCKMVQPIDPSLEWTGHKIRFLTIFRVNYLWPSAQL